MCIECTAVQCPFQCSACVCVCVGAYACVCVCVCTGAALVRSFTVLFGLRTVCHLFQCKWLCGVHRLPIPQQRSHFGMCDGWQGKPLPKRPRTLAALGNRVGQRPSSQQSPGGPLPVVFTGVQTQRTTNAQNRRTTLSDRPDAKPHQTQPSNKLNLQKQNEQNQRVCTIFGVFHTPARPFPRLLCTRQQRECKVV